MTLHFYESFEANSQAEAKEAICSSFRLEPGALDDTTILYAYYGSDCGYDGDACVIFELGGELFEVSGGHCSCYGLEDQWEPGKVTKESLAMYKAKYPNWKEFVEGL